MPSHLIFVSLFLGIASGKQPVDLQADATVKSIRILLAGKDVALLTRSPWHAEIDLGLELIPRELEAIGYDENNNEVGRASQIFNLPRPGAEVEIALQYGEALPTAAQLHWRNLEYSNPKSAKITFDGIPLKVGSDFRAQFPRTDWIHPHVIAAEMKFADGMTVRREIVIGGATFSDTARAELTPVLLTETSSQQPASYDDCLSLDGAPVRTAAVEKQDALVIFVRDPDPREAVRALDPARRATNPYTRAQMRTWAQLNSDVTQQVLWPIAQQFRDPSRRASSVIFEHWGDIAARAGLMWVLTFEPNFGRDKSRQYADAVAVAGVRAMTDGRRRAVVFVISDAYLDTSHNVAREVRRYLVSIGVPLFVWSVTGPRPELAESWGMVDDISSIGLLRAAVARVQQTLNAQRIAWVHADPLSALRIKADERCGVATVAR